MTSPAQTSLRRPLLAEILVPGSVAGALFVMFFSLPGEVMDWLLSLNITLSLIILFTAFFVRKPLEFSVFPTLLLGTTLFRLVLNVATTRLILTRADALGDQAAGEVISAFSRIVTDENFVVGVVVFLIFIIIQFVVLTKGATRISEVAARFTLDAMPGKQAAIDADLAAGLIDKQEAVRRREELADSADFFGAMDGAGKFVRGDAIAGLIIVGVNIVGGLLIGILQNKMAPAAAISIYGKLTIGDGLVAQVPALLISLATGILVSRGSRGENLPQRIADQLLYRPVIFTIGGFFMVLLVFTGLPRVPLMTIAAGSFLTAWTLNRHREEEEKAETLRFQTEERTKASEEREKERNRIERYISVDPLELELGIGLVSLTEATEGLSLMAMIKEIRITAAKEIGIIVPKVRVLDSLELDENRFRIRIYGDEAASGVIWPDMVLAVDADETGIRLEGVKTRSPSGKKSAFWIEERHREKAEIYGFRLLDPRRVVAEHLKSTVTRCAAELLTRDAVAKLLEGLRAVQPKAVDEVVPSVLKIGEVQAVLRRLLREQVPIRQLGAILEVLGDEAPRNRSPIYLTEQVRGRLARTLCGQYRNEDGELFVLMLDPELEEKVASGSDLSHEKVRLNLAPSESNEILGILSEQLENALLYHTSSPVLLVGDAIRPAVRALIEGKFPDLPVLSFGEITRDTRVVSDGIPRRLKLSA
ncbi:MAG: flagellar biosynthesis protein FlhA [Thermoguttaceae bacterium]|jgi:flagellar biosynthesis protein FlhA